MPTGAQEHRFAFLVAYYWHRNLKYNQGKKPLIKVFTLIILDNSAESMNASAVLIAQILIFTLSTVHKISEKCCKSLQGMYLFRRGFAPKIVLSNCFLARKSLKIVKIVPTMLSSRGSFSKKKSDERIEWKNK